MSKSKPHCTLAESEERAREIFALRARKLSQRAIGEIIGATRDAVAYYTSRRCKASIRAGVAG